jgi:YfiH family protein
VRELWRVPVADGSVVHVGFTTRADGDLGVTQDASMLEGRRRALVDLPWLWLRQVHGAAVVVVREPASVGELCGAEADAAVTALADVALSINVADCAPIALVGRSGAVAAVHAGWRGLEAGVIDATVAQMRSMGAGPITGYLGPCIHTECYEFGAAELASLVDRLGPAVRARTAGAKPALDVSTAVAAALGRAEVPLVDAFEVCTACGGTDYYSHRARGDVGRHALVVWRHAEDGAGG